MWQYHPTLLYLPCVSVPFIHKQYGHSFGFSLSQSHLFWDFYLLSLRAVFEKAAPFFLLPA